MFLKRFYDETLAQASYLIGCQETHHALVVDPNRHVEQYMAAAAAEELTINFVTETHIHADFVSGARDLARRANAKLLLSAHGGDDWSYRFAAADAARLLHDGESIDVGHVRVDVMHTPGHTPEHICFLVTDRDVSERPLGMLSGDFVFVGDVGRPDLLERAADIKGTMESMARSLFHSLERLRALPDYLQLWPGHGAGSACGKALGAVPSTTLGYERIANWAFQIADEDTFVREVLAGQPEPPAYFAVMKTVNRDGPAPPRDEGLPPRVDADALAKHLAADARVVDVRGSRDFAAEHIPGTINIPLGRSFATWAGSLIPYDTDIVLLAEGRDGIERAVDVLALIGLERIVAWGDRGVRDEWRSTHGALGSTRQLDAASVARRGDVQIVDVRGAAEWDTGHIPGARHLFLGNLETSLGELSRDAPIVTVCQGGSRSSIAASLLRAQGFENVNNLAGGVDAWKDAGLPIDLSS